MGGKACPFFLAGLWGRETERGRSRTRFSHLGYGSIVITLLPIQIKILKKGHISYLMREMERRRLGGSQFNCRKLYQKKIITMEGSGRGRLESGSLHTALQVVDCTIPQASALRLQWKCCVFQSCALWWPLSDLAFQSLSWLLCVAWKCPETPLCFMEAHGWWPIGQASSPNRMHVPSLQRQKQKPVGGMCRPQGDVLGWLEQKEGHLSIKALRGLLEPREGIPNPLPTDSQELPTE